MRCVARCGRLVGRRKRSVRIGSGSGRGSLGVSRARTRLPGRGCRRRLGLDGSARLGRRSRTRRHRCVDHHPAPTAPPLPGLGPRSRNGPTRSTPHRGQPRYLLLRPPKSLATRHQREHQRSPPPILPQRHRPLQTLKRRPGRCRSSPQRSTPQNPRLEDPSRGPHRTPRLPQTRQCCNDPLNPG